MIAHARIFCLAVLLVAVAPAALSAEFVRDIQPIFQNHCLKCHGSDKQKSGLRFDTKSGPFQKADSGEPAIVPGNSRASRLIKLVTSLDPEECMPPAKGGARLNTNQIALLKEWIEAGAAWPDSAGAPAKRKELTITREDRDHWSFRPLLTGRPPVVIGSTNFHQNAIDSFVGEKLTKKGLSPAPEAPRRTLIRRLYFDLTGLPPPPAEIATFEKDDSPDAYPQLVDRLLGSRHYGERWARHWLDLARYADSDGYEGDADRPSAWPYRDWVIRALNADLPFDKFARWQIAGDEYDPDNADAVAATGFLAAGPSQTTTPADTEENKLKIRYDELDDLVSTTSSAMLGLTIGCARCHDHKYDPIPTRDYYGLVKAFSTSRRAETFLSKPHREFELWKAEQHRAYRETRMSELGLTEDEKFWLRQPEHFFVPIQKEIYAKYGGMVKTSDDQLRAWLPEEKRTTWLGFESAMAKVASKPTIKALLVTDQQREPLVEYLLVRGSAQSGNEQIPLRFLQVLTRGRSAEDYWSLARPAPVRSEGESLLVNDRGFQNPATTYQRKALAEWLTDVDAGAGHLFARVIVNRLWQHHFGEGLVRTPNDFGNQGEAPTHPELLDWLASQLIHDGWRLKPLHRLIVMSAVYRQGNLNPNAGAAKSVDPDNRLLWRRRPMRLEAEALRDSILAVSGRLNRKMFGPPFRPIIPKEAMATRSKDAYPINIKNGPEIWRRSIYAFAKRSVPNPMLEVFDSPGSTASCARRNITTVPTQALTLMNDDFVRESAVQFAQRVIGEAGLDAAAQVRNAYSLALGREPSDKELTRSLEFLKTADDAASEALPVNGLTDVCHVLFTLNEFIYID